MEKDFTPEIRKLIAAKKAVLGTEQAIKQLKAGKLVKVYLASNCAPKTRETIKRYCSLGKVECSELSLPSEEVGVSCKKLFSISVIGVLK